MAAILKTSNAGGTSSFNRYVSVLAGNTSFIPNSFESIATTTVGAGGVSTVNFSSIPQTYKHLQIRILHRANGAANASLRFNTDSAGNYVTHRLLAGGTISGLAATGVTGCFWGYQATGTVGGWVIDILDYTNTNKYKTTRSLGGYDNNGGYTWMESSLWLSTAAINTIDLYASFDQYSQIALYGIKG